MDQVEARIGFANEVHQYIREYIQLADQKAAFFFALSGALIAYLESKGLLTCWINWPFQWHATNVSSFLATFFLSASIFFCIWVIKPRLQGNYRGIVFFSAISNFPDSNSYAREILSSSPEKLCEEKIKHAYEIALICRKKYHRLFFAICFGAAGVLFTGLLLFTK